MAGKRVAVVFDVVTSDSAKRLADVDFQLGEISKRLKEAKRLGQSDVYAELKQSQANLRQESKGLNQELRDQSKLFSQVANNIPDDSLVGLTNTYRSLRREIDQLSASQRNSDVGRNLINQAKNVKTQIDSVGASVGDFRTQVGRYKQSVVEALQQTGLLGSNLSGLFAGGGAIVAVGAAIGATIQAGKALFTLNKDIASLQADVQKTTGLTAAQVDNLTQSLKSLDTATTLEGLLQIAQAAGRLGVTGEEGVRKFTEAFDQVFIALGDEFTGTADEVATELGKLSNVLLGASTDGEVLAKNYLSLGNALNVLSASGASSAPVISDFASRISALAIPLGVLPGEVLGISATLEELGVTAERGGTAVGRIFTGITQAPKAFEKELGITAEVIKAAGFEAENFTDLVNTDLVGALQLVSTQALAANNNNVDLSQSLKTLKIDGAGELEVLLKLGTANERLSQNIGTANQALLSQSSITNEAAIRQENLAGISQRVINAFRELFVNSGFEAFFVAVGRGLLQLIQGFTQLLLILGQIPKFIYDNRVAILALGAAILAFNANLIAANATILITQARLVVFATAQRAAAIASGILRTAQIALNVALTANPIGLIVTAIGLLVAGFATAYKNSEQFRGAIDGLARVAREVFKIIGEAVTSFLDGFQKIGQGDFKGALKSFGDGIVKSNPIGIAFTQGERLGNAYNEGYASAIQKVPKNAPGVISDINKQIGQTAAIAEKSGLGLGKYVLTTKKVDDSTKDLTKTIKDANKEIDTLAKGSIAFLQKKLSDLNEQLTKAPSTPAFLKIQTEIQKTTRDLEILEATRARAFDAVSGVQNVVQTITTLDVTRFTNEQDLTPVGGIGSAAEDQRVKQEEEVAEIIKDLRKTTNEQLAAIDAEETKREKKEQETRAAQIADIASTTAGVVQGFVDGSIKTAEDFQKAILLIALEAIQKQFLIASFELLAREVGSKGFLGLVTAGILQGVLAGAFGALKSAIQGKAEGGEIRTYSGQRIGNSKRISGRGKDTVLIAAYPGEKVLNTTQQRNAEALYGSGIWQRIGMPDGFASGGLIRNTPQVINPNTAIQRFTDQSRQSSDVALLEAITQRFEVTAARIEQSIAMLPEGVEIGITKAGDKSDRRKALRKEREV